MTDHPATGVASKVAGAAAIATGVATAAGMVEGREWAAIAERAGMPFLMLALLVWAGITTGRWLAPYVVAVVNDHRAFVRSVQEQDAKHTAANEALVAIQAQQAESLSHLHGCVESLKSGVGRMEEQQRETNRLLRAASQTPQPPPGKG